MGEALGTIAISALSAGVGELARKGVQAFIDRQELKDKNKYTEVDATKDVIIPTEHATIVQPLETDKKKNKDSKGKDDIGEIE